MLFEKRSVSLTNPPDWLVNAFGQTSLSGELVSVDSAITVPAMYAAITIIAQDIAALPLILYRRLPRGKERATENPLYKLMHDQPNSEMTSYQFREIMLGHLIGWGNFYGQMLWNARGEVEQVWPLHPGRMEVGRKDGQRIYLYQNTQGQRLAFTQDEILHIPGFGFDGLTGRSIISLMRNTIGQAMALEKYGNRVLKNDARPSVALKHQGQLSKEAYERLRDSWSQAYGGADNAGKVAILEENMSLETIGFPAKDAQYIEGRQFAISEIARFLRIPPHMIGDVTRSTSWGSGIEQQELGYLTHTLRPWMVRIEQGLNKDLLFSWDKTEYFFEHLVDALLRTDINSRMQAYTLAIQNGIYTRNEVRERENLLPYEGGDDPLFPLNMTDGNDPEPQADPAAESDPAQDPPADPKRDLEPLLMDAARRIAKRDTNEMQGALRRWPEKSDKWNAWAEQFYKRDLPAYALQVLQPLVQARLLNESAARRFAQNLIDSRAADMVVTRYDIQPEQVFALLQEVSHA